MKNKTTNNHTPHPPKTKQNTTQQNKTKHQNHQKK